MKRMTINMAYNYLFVHSEQHFSIISYIYLSVSIFPPFSTSFSVPLSSKLQQKRLNDVLFAKLFNESNVKCQCNTKLSNEKLFFSILQAKFLKEHFDRTSERALIPNVYSSGSQTSTLPGWLFPIIFFFVSSAQKTKEREMFFCLRN